jgi:hypothetical protein
MEIEEKTVQEEVMQNTEESSTLENNTAEEIVSNQESVTDEQQGEGTQNDDSQDFHKNPKWNERIEQIEKKYGTSAKMWETIEQESTRDPKFGAILVERLEKNHVLPPGALEKYREIMKQRGVSLDEETKPAVEQKPTAQAQLSPEQEQAIAYARRKSEEESYQVQQAQNQLEDEFQSFEEKHSDIPKMPNASNIRKKIWLEAQDHIDKGMALGEALEVAYKWVVKREETLEEYKEKGEISGLIKSQISSQANAQVSSSSAPTQKSSRPLTEEEKAGARLLGVSNEEYLSYLGTVTIS